MVYQRSLLALGVLLAMATSTLASSVPDSTVDETGLLGSRTVQLDSRGIENLEARGGGKLHVINKCSFDVQLLSSNPPTPADPTPSRHPIPGGHLKKKTGKYSEPYNDRQSRGIFVNHYGKDYGFEIEYTITGDTNYIDVSEVGKQGWHHEFTFAPATTDGSCFHIKCKQHEHCPHVYYHPDPSATGKTQGCPVNDDVTVTLCA